MSYNYVERRSNLFTEEGVTMLVKMRDHTRALLLRAGAARMQEMMSGLSGDVWDMLACADYMVEKGELREITPPSTPGQHRVFVEGRES